MSRNIFRDNKSHTYKDEPDHSAQRKEQIALATRSFLEKEDSRKLQMFYKTALRILADQQKWQSEHPNELFKKRYMIGCTKKKMMNICFNSGLLFTDSTYYAVALEDLLRRIPEQLPNTVEW